MTGGRFTINHKTDESKRENNFLSLCTASFIPVIYAVTKDINISCYKTNRNYYCKNMSKLIFKFMCK